MDSTTGGLAFSHFYGGPVKKPACMNDIRKAKSVSRPDMNKPGFQNLVSKIFNTERKFQFCDSTFRFGQQDSILIQLDRIELQAVVSMENRGGKRGEAGGRGRARCTLSSSSSSP